jgi:hypothetical protein
MSAGAGDRNELGRYTISAGERVIYGQRVLGVVRVVDVPAGGRGRRYIVERGLTSMSELEAIVADYCSRLPCGTRSLPSRCACSRSRERRDEAARPRLSA